MEESQESVQVGVRLTPGVRDSTWTITGGVYLSKISMDPFSK